VARDFADQGTNCDDTVTRTNSADFIPGKDGDDPLRGGDTIADNDDHDDVFGGFGDDPLPRNGPSAMTDALRLRDHKDFEEDRMKEASVA